MKQYLLVDLISDYKEIIDYSGLKNLLIEELKRDTLDSIGEYDIVKDNLEVLAKMAREEKTSLDYIKGMLLGYSYKVIDLLDIQRHLEDIKQYFDRKACTGDFIEIIDIINKEVNKNE